MKEVFKEFHKLSGVLDISKHEQFIQGILNAIHNKSLMQGDKLPSVNEFMKETNFARETIAKGYKELILRGVVESKNRIGFFVANNNVQQQLKVALVLFAFDTFQETFYKTFRRHVGDNIQIDVFFHHNNIIIFENIIATIKGKYGMYIVAPIPHKQTASILLTLPMDKFLMVDRHEKLDVTYNYVTQEFKKSSYAAFSQLADTIRQFKMMHYYHRPLSDTPIEILSAFKKFVRDYKITHEICPEYIPGSLKKGHVYFTINNTELWAMLKDCKLQNLEIGKDVGILSHNDDIVKEIICDGITTYSTDFPLMAKKAAEFVIHRRPLHETIPTVLIRRNSL